MKAHLSLDPLHFKCSFAMGWLVAPVQDSRALDHSYSLTRPYFLSLDSLSKTCPAFF